MKYLLLASVLVLTACGGGGDDTPPPTKVVDEEPVCESGMFIDGKCATTYHEINQIPTTAGHWIFDDHLDFPDFLVNIYISPNGWSGIMTADSNGKMNSISRITINDMKIFPEYTQATGFLDRYGFDAETGIVSTWGVGIDFSATVYTTNPTELATLITDNIENNTNPFLSPVVLLDEILDADTLIYNMGSSYQAVEGIWTGYDILTGDTTYTITLVVDSIGNITGDDTLGCRFEGKIIIQDTHFNYYDVSLHSPNCTFYDGTPTSWYSGTGITVPAEMFTIALFGVDNGGAFVFQLTR